MEYPDHDHVPGANGIFCQLEGCGKLLDMAALKRIRPMGPIGVMHTNSPRVEAFWNSGDPSVLVDPVKRAKKEGLD